MAKHFEIKIKPIAQVALPKDQGFVLRPQQRKEYDTPSHQFRLSLGAGGSGKTVTQKACAIKEMRESNFMQRQAICSSQSMICHQFAENTTMRLDCSANCFDVKLGTYTCNHKVTVWDVRHEQDLSHDTSKGVLDKLEKFYMRTKAQQEAIAKKLRQTGSFTGLVVITTHAAMARVFNERILPKLQSGEYSWQRVRDAMTNVTTRVDESHHVGGFSNKDPQKGLAEAGNDTNGLGRFLSFCYRKGDDSTRFFFTTATHYRESVQILLGGLPKRFHISILTLSEWLRYTSIEEIAFVLEEYDGKTPIAAIAKNLKREPEEKALVINPAEGTKWLQNISGEKGEKKAKVVRMEMRAFKDALPSGKVLVDTVDPVGRHKRKAGLKEADVIITVMCVREGVDVPSISRIHHTAMERSKGLALQTILRALREHEGKKRVEVRYYVPRIKDVSAVKTREDFSDRVNITLLLADIRDVLSPLFAVKDITTLGKYAKHFSREEKHLDLESIFSTLGLKSREVRDTLYLRLDLLEKKTKPAMLQIINDVLKDNGVAKENVSKFKLDVYLLADYLMNIEEPDDRPQVAKAIRRLKFNLQINPLDYIRSKFDGIKEEAVGVYSGTYNKHSLNKLRRAFHKWEEELSSIKKALLKAKHIPLKERYQVLTKEQRTYLISQFNSSGIEYQTQ